MKRHYKPKQEEINIAKLTGSTGDHEGLRQMEQC